MPHLCRLARQGASCFSAQTVHPSITLPAHTSLLRGVDPAVHGTVDNTPVPLSDEWPSFLRIARMAGLSTAALLNWTQVNGIVEADAVDIRHFLNGGYGADDDARIAAASTLVLGERPDVAFVYLVSPDLDGHEYGWGSTEYLGALARSDHALGQVIEAAADAALIVTTDHGGEGNDHQQSRPLDLETFVIVRAQGVEPASTYASASILDVAPTVAELAGFEAAGRWSGSSLIGRETSIADTLLAIVASMAGHRYGERVDMLEHSLQTASVARLAGATDELVLAALLHDVGHLLGDAGRWGLADHATVGARALQQILPASVVDPIRLHVAAKRHLVAVESDYAESLSAASQQSLIEQGGPFTAAESAAFEAEPRSDDAIALRRFDDAGKATSETEPTIRQLSGYLPLLRSALLVEPIDARWWRDICACTECRDADSGQHLIDVTHLDGWRTRGVRSGHTIVTDAGGRDHVVDVADAGADAVSGADSLIIRLWNHGHLSDMMRARRNANDDIAGFVTDLSTTGIAVASGLATTPGTVLDFAERFGFVRRTNYGDLFDVITKVGANNLAYTSLGLPLHTDNPYRDPVPTVQVLHCLSPADVGGCSRFSDGFAAAERLRAEHPAAFDMLTSTAVDFRFADDEVDLRARCPLIELDVDGVVRAVRVNHRSMMTPPPGPQVGAFYDAYSTFVRIICSPEQVIDLDLRGGDVVAFDNRRVLHARTAYSGTTTRHLQGCYVDIDAVRSLARRAATSHAETAIAR